MPTEVTETYTVKKGDTLEGICKKYKIKDWKKLWNHRDNKKLNSKRKGNERALSPKDVLVIPPDLSPIVQKKVEEAIKAEEKKREAAEKKKRDEERARKEAEARKVTVKIGKKTFEFKDQAEADKFMKTVRIVEVKGKKVAFIGDKEWEKFQKEMLSEIRQGALLVARQRSGSADTLWNHFNDLNNDQYIVSWFVSLTGPDLPSKTMITTSNKAFDACEAAVKSGDFKKIHAAFKTAEPLINKAYFTMQDYQKGTIGSAEGWVTGLEVTKTAAFATVGAIATPIVAPAVGSAALAGAIVSGGTAVVASTSNEIGKGIAGTSKGPEDALKNIAFDGIIGATVGAVLKSDKGKAIIEGTSKKLAEKASATVLKKVSHDATKKFIETYLNNAGQSAMESAVQEAGKVATGKTKPDQFIGNVAKSALLGGFMKKFDKAVETKYAKSIYDSLSTSAKNEFFKGVKPEVAVKVIDEAIKGNANTAAGQALDSALKASSDGDPDKAVADAAKRLAKQQAFLKQIEAIAVAQ